MPAGPGAPSRGIGSAFFTPDGSQRGSQQPPPHRRNDPRRSSRDPAACRADRRMRPGRRGQARCEPGPVPGSRAVHAGAIMLHSQRTARRRPESGHRSHPANDAVRQLSPPRHRHGPCGGTVMTGPQADAATAAVRLTAARATGVQAHPAGAGDGRQLRKGATTSPWAWRWHRWQPPPRVRAGSRHAGSSGPDARTVHCRAQSSAGSERFYRPLARVPLYRHLPVQTPSDQVRRADTVRYMSVPAGSYPLIRADGPRTATDTVRTTLLTCTDPEHESRRRNPVACGSRAAPAPPLLAIVAPDDILLYRIPGQVKGGPDDRGKHQPCPRESVPAGAAG